ncbi:hypothetical protein JCM5353_002882 [Sporobolomyces roseus]
MERVKAALEVHVAGMWEGERKQNGFLSRIRSTPQNLKRHRAAKHGDPGSHGKDENDEDEAENSIGEAGGSGASSSISQRRDQTTSDISHWPRIRSPILDSPPPAPPVSYSRAHPQLSHSITPPTPTRQGPSTRQCPHSIKPYPQTCSHTQGETHYLPYVAASSTHLVHRTASRSNARHEHYPYDPRYRRRHGSPLQNPSIEHHRQPRSSEQVNDPSVASQRSGVDLNGFDIPTSPPDSSFQDIPRTHLTSPPEHNPSYPPSFTRNRIRYSIPHNAPFDPDSTNPALHDHFPPTSSFQHSPSSHTNVTDTDTADFDHLREYSPDTLSAIAHSSNSATKHSLGKAQIPLSHRQSLRYHDLVIQ